MSIEPSVCVYENNYIDILFLTICWPCIAIALSLHFRVDAFFARSRLAKCLHSRLLTVAR
jgi:hypothetical protein